MDGEELEELVRYLHQRECLDEEAEALATLDKLSSAFTSELSDLTAKLFIASVLSGKHSVATFIIEASSIQSHTKAVTKGFELLEYIITNFKVSAPYYTDVLKSCLFVSKSSVSTKVKEPCLKVLKTLVKVADHRVDVEGLMLALKEMHSGGMKVTPTMFMLMCRVQGVVFKRHPDGSAELKDWFLERYLQTLHHEMVVAREPNLTMVEGCFKALDGFLTNFPLEEDSAARVYGAMEVFCRGSLAEEKRRVVYRAGLRLFANHSNVFARRVYLNHVQWQDSINKWIVQTGEDRRAGYHAAVELYRRVAAVLEEAPEDGLEVFQRYLTFLRQKVAAGNAMEARAAWLGLGELASCWRRYGSDSDLQAVVQDLMHHAAGPAGPGYLPVYLESLAKFIGKAGFVQELGCLERLSVALVEQFPSIEPQFQEGAVRALEVSLYSVLECGLQALDTHLQHLVYQGLIRSSLHPVWIDVELQKELGDRSAVSYKSYLPLWRSLLDMMSRPAAVQGAPFEAKRGVSTAVVDCFMSAFLRIIKKLDLSVDRKNVEVSDPEVAMEAARPRDFQIFVNVVDLFRDLVPQTNGELLSKWFVPLLEEAMALCGQSPLVSGFYKVLSTVLAAVDEARYLDADHPCSGALSRFLESVLVRAEQYKGDLQIACLQTLLAAPVCLVAPFVAHSAPALLAMARVGSGYPPLLHQLMETLDRWNASLPPEVVKGLLLKVLPSFDVYLQSRGFRDAKFEALEGRTRELKSRGKVRKRLHADDADSQLVVLQRAMLSLLGRLDPEVTVSLARDAGTSVGVTVKERLPYRVPFEDVKPAMNLNDLLPRVMDLALLCGDRETRVTACELLHAIAMVALGSATRVREETGSDMLRRLLDTGLLLGCDSDHVVRQLFEPFLLQAAHFFSSKIQLNSSETAAFVTVLMDNVTHPFDSSVRDFAARCVREFLTWSVKQLTADEARSNVTAVLNHMVSYLMHPDGSKRQGAALMFNNIYSVVREDRIFLNTHWLLIYHGLVRSLAMCRPGQDDTQLRAALDHVARPLIELPGVFNLVTSDRRVPPGFEGGTLRDVAVWTYHQCLSLPAAYRAVSQRFLQQIAPLVSGCTSLPDFLQRFVPGYLNPFDLPAFDPDADSYTEWLQRCFGAFSYYNWLAEVNALDAKGLSHLEIKVQVYVTTCNWDDSGVRTGDTDRAKSLTTLLLLDTWSALLRCHVACGWTEDPAAWSLIVTAAFQPARLGFERNDRSSTTRLKKCLVALLDCLNSALSNASWHGFADKFKLPATPPRVRVSEREGDPEVVDLVNGVAILQATRAWDRFGAVLNWSGGDVLMAVYTALFVTRGKRVTALAIDPATKVLLDQCLSLCLKLDTPRDLVMQCILNEEEVRDEATYRTTTKGEYFLMQFKDVLFVLILRDPESALKSLLAECDRRRLDIVVSMLQFLLYSDAVDKEGASGVLLRVLAGVWPELQDTPLKDTQDAEKKSLLLLLVKEVCQIQAKSVGSLVEHTALAEWLLSRLQRNLDTGDLATVLSLLPQCCLPFEEVNSPLWINLMNFWKTHRIFQTTVLTGSPDHATVVAMYSGMFEALRLTGSLAMLRFILKILPSHAGHLPEEMGSSLVDLTLRGPEGHFDKLLGTVFATCFPLPLLTLHGHTGIRVACDFLCTLLKSCPEATVRKFFLDHLGDLYDIMMQPLEQTSLSEACVEMTQKTCAVLLLQAFYFKITREDIARLKTEQPLVVQKLKFLVDKCRERVQAVLGCEEVLELVRQHRCACFNALCTVVAIQNDPRPYEILLFSSGENALWHGLVDESKEFELGIDFDKLPKRKKMLTTLRRAATAERQRDANETIKSLRYAKTATLFESTLHEDVTKFDFTHSSVRSMNSVPGGELRGGVEVELELDQLNDHECMATACAVACHMAQEAIGAQDRPPSWLTSILGTLRYPGTGQNTRLFLLKLLCNLEQLVQPFAQDVVPTVIRCVTEILILGPINYFIMDLIVMVISWKSFVATEDIVKQDITELVQQLIERTDALRADVVKNNIEVVRTLVEVWKRNVFETELSNYLHARVTDERSLLGSSNDGSSVRRRIDIHMSSILLANRVPVWRDTASCATFLQAMLRHLRHDKKNHKMAAEVCGLTLSYLEDIDAHNLKDCHQAVSREILDYFCADGGSDMSRLFYVHKFYPKISSEFVSRIQNCVWTSNSVFMSEGLEMLLSHARRMKTLGNDNFSATVKLFLAEVLKRSEGQELSLQLFEALVDKVDLGSLVGSVVRLSESKASVVRKHAQRLLMKLYDKYNDEEESVLKTQCKVALLKGLTDPDQDLQTSCLAFWNAGRIPRLTCERFLFIFREFYTADTEVGFLHYTARLMLEASKRSADYKLKLFDRPLAKCDYQDYKLLVSWRARNVTQAPMFAQTIASQLSRTDVVASLGATPGGDFRLRATVASLMFEPTVVPEDEEDDGEETFVAGPSHAPRDPDPSFKVPTVSHLRRRFLRNTQNISSYFAKRQSAKKQEVVEREEERVKKRDLNVAIYRDYRMGDFPDIEISHAHILKPLEVLARKDPQLARQLLVSLFSGIVDYFSDDPRSSQQFVSSMGGCIESVLKTSTSFDPSVLAFVFQVALEFGDKFQLDPGHVAAVAKASGWLSTGALLVEHSIVHSGDTAAPTAKKVKVADGEDCDWLHLAELYHGMKEFDALRGIFLDKVNVEGNVAEAIQCEASGDWFAASEIYGVVLKDQEDSRTTHFYAQSYLTCLAHLSDWGKLKSTIEKSVNGSIGELWTEAWCQEQLLPWYLNAAMMESLKRPTDDFKALLQTYSSDKSTFDILNNRFCEALAVGELLNGNTVKAKHYLDRFSTQFLDSWSHLDRFSESLRCTKLLQLQTVAELQQMAGVLAEPSLTEVEGAASRLVEGWQRVLPKAQHHLLTWDVKMTLRKLLLKLLTESRGDMDLGDMKRSLVLAQLGLASVAREQENFHLMRRYLLEVRSALTAVPDPEIHREYDYCLLLGEALSVKQTQFDTPRAGVSRYVKMWSKMDDALRKHEGDDSDAARRFLVKLHRTVAELVSGLVSHSESARDLLAVHLGLQGDDAAVEEQLHSRAKHHLEAAILLTDSGSMGQLADVHLQLAKLCREHPVDIPCGIRNLLQAMKLGQPEARQLFCTVLTTSELPLCPSLPQLVEETRQVPSWMFLPWTNQLLACLDTALLPFIKDIVLRLAADYPNAIRYSFSLSKEKYKTDEPELTDVVARLSAALQDPLYDRFCVSLGYLASPFLVLKYYLDKIKAGLDLSEPPWDEVERTMAKVFKRLYEGDGGGIFKWVSPYKESLQTLRGSGRNVELWRREAVRIVGEIGKSRETRLSERLRSYSPWLFNFKGLTRGGEIEVPGQYVGGERPLVKYHATVSSFQPEVLPLDSKTKPLRITILGNDAVEYKFLVKFGEDLRQDQRIQQVFATVNHVLQGRHRLEVYGVVPLSSSLGLIEWVDNTKSLQDLVVSSLRSKARLDEARAEHMRFLARGNPEGRPVGKIYDAAYLTVPRGAAVEQFNARAHAFPWDLLRRAFWTLSTSPEHFVYLRRNLAVSQALIFVAHWLVGIGDRHLQNTLVCTRTGRAVGIDFGYAFGFATQFLTPPELVPFRMTPQVAGLLRPLEESGWVKQTMVHCLRCLRKNPSVLLATLEVFALEPSLDWVEQARRQAADRSEGDLQADWYPQQKLAAVRRKLEGASPVDGLREDLTSGHASKGAVLDKYLEVLKGEEAVNCRARTSDKGLSAEQQVDCLLDLATDRHVLAKTYVGWDPWI